MFLLLSVACLGRKGAPSKGSPGLAGLQTGAPVAGFASICCTRAQVPPRGGMESLCPPAAFLRSFLCPCSFGSCASLCSPCLVRVSEPTFSDVRNLISKPFSPSLNIFLSLGSFLGLLSVLEPPSSPASSCFKHGGSAPRIGSICQEGGILVQLFTGCISAHLPWNNVCSSVIMFGGQLLPS